MAWKQPDKRDPTSSPPSTVASFPVFHTSDVEENKLSMNSMAGFSAPEHKGPTSVSSLTLQITTSLDLQQLAIECWPLDMHEHIYGPNGNYGYVAVILSKVAMHGQDCVLTRKWKEMS